MPNRAVVITVSDRCSVGEMEDRSGPAIIDMLPDLDAHLVHRETVPDEIARIQLAARPWLGRCELLVATGGTGIAERDRTPEALLPLIERPLPGFGEAMRMRAFAATPLSIVSRGGAGVTSGTLVIWLPGSPKAVRESLEALAPAIRHVCGLLRGADGH